MHLAYAIVSHAQGSTELLFMSCVDAMSPVEAIIDIAARHILNIEPIFGGYNYQFDQDNHTVDLSGYRQTDSQELSGRLQILDVRHTNKATLLVRQIAVEGGTPAENMSVNSMVELLVSTSSVELSQILLGVFNNPPELAV